jgi:hypothetical protein
MIDPSKVGWNDPTDDQLEEFLIFSIAVAGKTAIYQAAAVERFLNSVSPPGGSPFEKVRWMIGVKDDKKGTALRVFLENSKLGQYGKLEKAFTQLVEANLNLRTCTAEDLEKIHGIGLKTSRFFLTYTRKDQQYGILDTHILHWMRDTLHVATPKSTPTNSKQYAELEKIFLAYVNESGRTVADVDLKIWKKYSGKHTKEKEV